MREHGSREDADKGRRWLAMPATGSQLGFLGETTNPYGLMLGRAAKSVPICNSL